MTLYVLYIVCEGLIENVCGKVKWSECNN